jgi:O-antigen ligase
MLGGVNVIVPHASATFGNVNNYGTVISFVIPYLLWGILEGTSGKNKLVYLTGLFLGILFIVINGQRMGILVAGFFIFCFSFLFFKHLKRRYIVGGIIVLFCVAAFLPVNSLLYTTRYRIAGMLTAVDESSNERWAMIKSGFEMLKESYGAGIGAGGFESAVVRQSSFLGNIINPHNLFVEIFAQYGVLIIAGFCFWLLAIFYRARSNKNLSPGARMLVCSTVIALPFIGAMSSHALGYTYLWMFLSFITIIASYQPASEESQSIKK